MKSEFAIPVVGALILNSKDQIFLMQSSGKFGDQWIVPGGKVNFGETLKNALKREIFEETGLDIQQPILLGTREFIQPERHFIFFEHGARIDREQKVILNYEAKKWGWFNREDALMLNLAGATRDFIVERLESALQR